MDNEKPEKKPEKKPKTTLTAMLTLRVDASTLDTLDARASAAHISRHKLLATLVHVGLDRLSDAEISAAAASSR